MKTWKRCVGDCGFSPRLIHPWLDPYSSIKVFSATRSSTNSTFNTLKWCLNMFGSLLSVCKLSVQLWACAVFEWNLSNKSWVCVSMNYILFEKFWKFKKWPVGNFLDAAAFFNLVGIADAKAIWFTPFWHISRECNRFWKIPQTS